MIWFNKNINKKKNKKKIQQHPFTNMNYNFDGCVHDINEITLYVAETDQDY